MQTRDCLAINAGLLFRSTRIALIYNGKEYSRYEKQTTNHPYLVNAEFEEGTISSGKTLYPRLLMKLDLFRDELVLQSPKKLYPVVAEKDQSIISY